MTHFSAGPRSLDKIVQDPSALGPHGRAREVKVSREMGFECSSDAIGDRHPIVDESPAIFNKLAEGAHRRALGPEGLELVAVLEQDVERQSRVSRVILGTARMPGVPIARGTGG